MTEFINFTIGMILGIAVGFAFGVMTVKED